MIYLLRLLLLAVSSASPLRPDSCLWSSKARPLLSSLTHIMEKQGKMGHQDLFAGFNCTDLETVMIPHTHTAAVCQPDNSGAITSCSSQRSSSFRTSECLRSIRADLCYYDQLLKSYEPRAADLSPVMTATTELINCVSARCDSSDAAHPQWRVWGDSTFDNRVSLCKTLKGFHVRAITINRALAYIASGDHRNAPRTTPTR